MLFMFSNNGSLYAYKDDKKIIIASEYIFLKKIKLKYKLKGEVEKLIMNKLIQFEQSSFKLEFSEYHIEKDNEIKHELVNQIKNIDDRVKLLKRCQKCILPETYPLIKFNSNGVCNYCEMYDKQKFLGEKKLLNLIGNKDTKILFGLSGGRDSCYGLYYLYEILGYKNIITYTYDWGLTTDIARKNISNFCQKYSIENIVRSANIYKKRSYIKKNILAWLRKPNLGMVPIFFIGDKPFLYYGTDLKNETDSKVTIHGTGFQCEQMEFKVAYCGVNQKLKNNIRMYGFDIKNKIKLFNWYFIQFLKNPSYFNSSLIDNITGFYSSFIHKDKAIHLYNYIKYDTDEVDKTLEKLGYLSDKKYGDNQWRAGDGQTAFTNYIYYQIGGFSEYDNYRSNQVREGYISREKALELTIKDNIPKLETISNFCNLIGLNTEEILLKISNIKKKF